MNVKRIYNIFTPWKIELYYRFKGMFFHSKQEAPSVPKKILLCNQGALGDVFLTTCMIPSLKETFQGVLIGVLIEPSSLPAVQVCPGIDIIHEKEAWFYPKDSKWKKLQKALNGESVQYDYDWVICTFPFYRGIGSSLRNIPFRGCFETIGDRIYFNHITPWSSGYIGEQYIRLLKTLGVSNPKLESPWNFPLKDDHVIFHMGSADATKEFSSKYWEDLAVLYRSEGKKIIFTGSGDRQKKLIDSIAEREENYCNRLSFSEFIKKIAECDHVITVDTVTMHIAAMLKKPYFALFRKPLDFPLWYPNTKEGAYILEN